MEDSLRQMITEEDFRGELTGPLSDFLAVTRQFRGMLEKDSFRQYLSFLGERAHELESFLDEYGARSNRTYAFVVKLVASSRWIARGLFALEHLGSRFGSYVKGAASGEHQDLLRELRQTTELLRGSLESLHAALEEEASTLSCLEVRSTFEGADSVPGTNPGRRVLPQNLGDGEDVLEEEQRIIEIASRFARVQDEIGKANITGPEESVAVILKSVRSYYDEERARRLEAAMHGLQAKYDTYVRGTGLERAHPDLTELRGVASICLHLLEAGTNLIHFYERHESGIRQEEATDRIARIVDDSMILERVHNFVLLFVSRYARRGREIADRLIPNFTKDVTCDLTVPSGTWVHVRPAHRIVGIVNHYGSPVQIEIDGESCEANSILQVMMLMGSHPDTRVIRFRGDEKPLRDLKLLFKADLGESDKPLPEELSYLG
ncbi:MAG: HPr family phosphocarrier protein [Planctomycetota bacterium]